MFIDPLGLDAVVLNNQGTPVGHMSMMMQDAKDKWYFFFFGDTVQLVGLPNEVFDANGQFDLAKLNQWLVDEKLNSGLDIPYNNFVYIEGDFTKSYGFAQNCVARYESDRKAYPDFKQSIAGFDNYNLRYNVLLNNCSHVTMEALFMGILPNGRNAGEYFFGYYMLAGPGTLPLTSIPNANLELLQIAFGNKSLNYTPIKDVRSANFRTAKIHGFLTMQLYNVQRGIEWASSKKLNETVFYGTK